MGDANINFMKERSTARKNKGAYMVDIKILLPGMGKNIQFGTITA